jgi:hypothetical protein
MTDKLRDSMNARADAASFAPVDLDAVVGAGSRAVRRRRAAAVGAAAAGMVAVVVLVFAVVTPGGDRARRVDPAPSPDPYPTSVRSLAPAVAVGARLHVGGSVTTLDHPVEAFVRTLDDVVVFLTAVDLGTGIADVRAWDGERSVELGHGTDLVSDQDGHLAAWLTDAGELAVVDTRTLEVSTIRLETGPRPSRLHDVDGRTAYLTDGRGGLELDLVTGATSPVAGWVVDAEHGTVVTAALAVLDEESVDGVTDPAEGLFASTDAGRTRLPATRSGVLSPDGSRLATPDRLPVAGSPRTAGVDVVDVRTGDRVALDTSTAVAGVPFAVEPVGWLDTATVSLYWTSPQGDERLLSCDATTGRCDVAIDVSGLPDDGSAFPVFTGETTFDRR